MKYSAHPTAVIDDPVEIGEGTAIWHFVHICEEAKIGKHCVLGQNVMVGKGVSIGNHVKIQNNVAVYSGVTIDDDVFLGPSCVLTNVTNPRSQIVRKGLFEETLIRRGATVGANATIICGVTLGRYCFIGAGAVVTSNVPDYALMLGVPAKQQGWMSRHGHPLVQKNKDGFYCCPEGGLCYEECQPGLLRCIELNEEAPLPKEQQMGRSTFRALKSREKK